MATRRHTTRGVVYVTATPPGWDRGAAVIRAIHKAQDRSDSGYNETINPNGWAEMGRGKMAVGAHVAGFNSNSYGLVDGRRRQCEQPAGSQHYQGRATRHAWTVDFPRLKSYVNGRGIIGPFEQIKACPCFDVIPWARERGLPVADIKGTWKRVVLDPESAPVLEGPDTHTAYLQRLLMRGEHVFGPIDCIAGKRTRAAIPAFHLASDLPETGEFNPVTVAPCGRSWKPRLRPVFTSSEGKIMEKIESNRSSSRRRRHRTIGIPFMPADTLCTAIWHSTPSRSGGRQC
jgi:peptidoglycan hydrolase-like protein with peptidoglycan-binding domain